MPGTHKSALDLRVYARPGVRCAIPSGAVQARVMAVLRAHGEISLSDLHRVLHHNVAQERLHAVLAVLRDEGRVTIQETRRFRTGRPRIEVGLVERPEASPGSDEGSSTR